jgi:hypothetical protein
MARQLAKRRQPSKRRGKQLRRRTPRVLQKVAAVADRVLDELIEDPERVIDRAERAAEQVARGVDRFFEEYNRDPVKARQDTRDFIIRNLAKFGKKKLRGAK